MNGRSGAAGGGQGAGTQRREGLGTRLLRAFVEVVLPEGGCALCGAALPQSAGREPAAAGGGAPRPAGGGAPRPGGGGAPRPGEAGLSWRDRVCDECLADIAPAADTAAGLGLPSPTAGLLDGVVTVGLYRGAVEKAVLRLKTVPDRRLAAVLAEAAAEVLAGLPGGRAGWWGVVPVPLHPARLRERGFNQAALLGAELARLLDAPLLEDLVERVRPTPRQTSLSRRERMVGLVGAFRVRRPAWAPLEPVRLLAVDDVVTTGATVSELARALKAAGAAQVWGAAAARAAARAVARAGTHRPEGNGRAASYYCE